MMKIKWIITCLAVVCFLNSSLAQESNRLSLQYSIAYPTSGLKEYIGQTSFRGIEFSYHYLLTPEIGLGFGAGMNTFYERERGTFREGTSAITGTQYRYANLFPIMASFSYYLKPEQAFSPYLNLGVGTLYSSHQTDIGLYSSGIQDWHFNIKPEVGLIYLFNPDFGLKLSAKYYQAFATDDLGSQSYGALGLGIVFSGRRR